VGRNLVGKAAFLVKDTT